MSDRAKTIEEFLSSYVEKKFHWKNNNCCTFVASWLENTTKKDYMKGLSPRYSDKRTALFLTKEVGGILKEAEKLFDGCEISLGQAKVGDIVCGEAGNGDTMGICIGVYSAFLTEQGIITFRTAKMKRIWRVT